MHKGEMSGRCSAFGRWYADGGDDLAIGLIPDLAPRLAEMKRAHDSAHVGAQEIQRIVAQGSLSQSSP